MGEQPRAFQGFPYVSWKRYTWTVSFSNPVSDANADAPILLVVSDDLMLPSRIRESAKPLGYVVQTVASEASVWETVRKTPAPHALLVGLTARRMEPLALIAALKADAQTAHLPIIAFAGHVETEKHQAAREAGADFVVANSSVALHLPQLLKRFAPSAHDEEAGAK